MADPIAKLSYALFSVDQPQSKFSESFNFERDALVRRKIDPKDPFLGSVPIYKHRYPKIRTT
jgi:hypothetical protein